MDAFVLNYNPATRGGLNLGQYLTGLYNLLEEARPGAAGKHLIEAVITATIAVSKGGNITSENCDKICQAVQEENGMNMTITPEQISVVYSLLAGQLRRNNVPVGDCLRNMAQLFAFDDFMRVNLTITQALGVGASSVTLVLQAIKAYPNHEVWAYLASEAPTEMAAFRAASRTVARSQLIGLGSHRETETIKGALFPSVAFAACQLLTIKGQMPTVKRFKANWVTPKSGTITNLINKVEATELEDVDLDDYRDENAVIWATELVDLNFILDSLKV